VIAADTLTLMIRGRIGSECETSLKSIRRQLRAFGAIEPHSRVHLDIDSTGGNVDEAERIYEIVRALPIDVSATVTGKCFSAAVTIFLAAAYRSAVERAEFLLHPTRRSRESLPEVLTALDFETRATDLRTSDRRAVDLLHARTGHDRAWFKSASRHESYFGIGDALAVGLVHAVEGASGVCHPDWPAYVAAMRGRRRDVHFPAHVTSANFLAACRAAPPAVPLAAPSAAPRSLYLVGGNA
jgi:ATP-dependent protease ClpP protease subunit